MSKHKYMKKIFILTILLVYPVVTMAAWYDIFNPLTWFQENSKSNDESLTLGVSDPVSFTKSLWPIQDSVSELGTSTKAYLRLTTDEICLNGDCQTAWSAGGGEANTGASLGTGLNIFDSKVGTALRFNSIAAGSNITLSTSTNSNTIVISSTGGSGGTGTISTSSPLVSGQSVYATGVNTIASAATGTISVPTGLTGTANRYVIGGNFALGLDTGYVIPLQSTLDGKINVGTTSVNSITTLNNLSITKSQVSDFGTYENPLTFTFPLSRSSNTISFNGLGTTTNSGLSQGFLYVGSGGLFQTVSSSTALASKQDTLVSGTNIKTINGASVLGSGDLTVVGATALASSTPWTFGSLVVAKDNGSVTTIATSTLKTSELTNDAGFLTSLAGAASSTLLADTNSWSGTNRFGNASSTYHSFITASSTNLVINGESFNDLTGTGLALSGNALVTSNIPNASLTNSTISGIALGSNLANLSATDSTLTFSGTYNGGTARTVGLNLGNANTWTALQTFGYSSTTGASFGYASSTDLRAGTLRISGLSDGCLNISTGVVGSTGSACGSGGGAAYDWQKETNFSALSLTPTTTIPVWFKGQIQASSSLQFNTNLISEHASLRFLDIQGRANGDYTLARIKAPLTTPYEATLALLLDESGDNSGVNESFFDLYNEGYGDSYQAGFRLVNTGTARPKPIVLGHYDDDGLSKDNGNKLVLFPSGTVWIGQGTSTASLTTQLHVSSSTATTLMNIEDGVGTSRLSVSGTGFGTTTLAGLNISGQATTTSNVGFRLTGGCYAGIDGACISGGSGASSVGAVNVLQASNGSGGFISTGTPQLTVGNIRSTSTSASFFTGGLTVGSQVSEAYQLTSVGTNNTTGIGDLGILGTVQLGTTDGNTIGYQHGQANTSGTVQTVAGWDFVGNSHAVGAQSASIAFTTRNAGSFGERLRINFDGKIGIGTTTPSYLLNPFSATAPQLSLSAGAGLAQWAFRNAGGNLYLSTTTIAGTATTTTSALSILNTGEVIVRNLFQIFNVLGTKVMDVAGNAVTLLGAWDFGGADSLEIPNGTNPTTDATGELAWDTTSGNLEIATSTGHVVIGSATTTIFSSVGTTTGIVSGLVQEIPPHPLQQVVTSVWCKVTSGTSLQVYLSDGTNNTNTITCTTTGTQYAITTNNTWTSYETMQLVYGTKTGNTGDIVLRAMGYRISD